MVEGFSDQLHSQVTSKKNSMLSDDFLMRQSLVISWSIDGAPGIHLSQTCTSKSPILRYIRSIGAIGFMVTPFVFRKCLQRRWQ